MRFLLSLIFLITAEILFVDCFICQDGHDILQEPIDANNPWKTDDSEFNRTYVSNVAWSGVTGLTLKLDAAIQRSQSITDNIVFSPIGITSVLGTVLLGSRGETFHEIARLLGLEPKLDLNKNSEIVHEVISSMLRQGNENADGLRYDLASGIFVQEHFGFNEAFIKCDNKTYNTQINHVDFEYEDDDRVRKLINDWVKDKTQNKINNILENVPSRDTAMIIASALNFEGEWQYPFETGVIRKDHFTTNTGEDVITAFMINTARLPYFYDKEAGVEIIGFPYKNSNVTMYSILPDKGVNLEYLKVLWSTEYLDALIGKTSDSMVTANFPKMKLTSKSDLRDSLELLGLESIFPYADLSVLSSWNYKYWQEGNESKDRRNSEQDSKSCGIDKLRNDPDLGSTGLIVNKVLHQVELRITEHGTEQGTETCSAIPADKHYDGASAPFSATRPFVLFIRNDITKMIYLWATVNRPMPIDS